MPVNRHERRAAAARVRAHNNFFNNYVRHLPEVSLDETMERGAVYHIICMHDDWCAIHDSAQGDMSKCNCNPIVKRYKEPKRC